MFRLGIGRGIGLGSGLGELGLGEMGLGEMAQNQQMTAVRVGRGTVQAMQWSAHMIDNS